MPMLRRPVLRAAGDDQRRRDVRPAVAAPPSHEDGHQVEQAALLQGIAVHHHVLAGAASDGLRRRFAPLLQLAEQADLLPEPIGRSQAQRFLDASGHLRHLLAAQGPGQAATAGEQVDHHGHRLAVRSGRLRAAAGLRAPAAGCRVLEQQGRALAGLDEAVGDLGRPGRGRPLRGRGPNSPRSSHRHTKARRFEAGRPGELFLAMAAFAAGESGKCVRGRLDGGTGRTSAEATAGGKAPPRSTAARPNRRRDPPDQRPRRPGRRCGAVVQGSEVVARPPRARGWYGLQVKRRIDSGLKCDQFIDIISRSIRVMKPVPPPSQERAPRHAAVFPPARSVRGRGADADFTRAAETFEPDAVGALATHPQARGGVGRRPARARARRRPPDGHRQPPSSLSARPRSPSRPRSWPTSPPPHRQLAGAIRLAGHLWVMRPGGPAGAGPSAAGQPQGALRVDQPELKDLPGDVKRRAGRPGDRGPRRRTALGRVGIQLGN